MAKITKRNDGRWEIRFTYTDIEGKKKTKQFIDKNKTTCEEKMSAFKKENKRQLDILSRNPKLTSLDPTFNEWVQIWLEEYCKPKVSNQTFYHYNYRLNKYLVPRIGDVPLSKMTTTFIQKTLAELQQNGRILNTEEKGKGLSAETIHRVKDSLQTCLQGAVDEGLLEENPTTSVKLPKLEIKNVTMSENEIAAFLESAKKHHAYELYFLELSTGLRLGELVALDWEDLDAENCTITVQKQIQRLGYDEIEIAPLRSESWHRTITISQECVDLLLHMKDMQPYGTKMMFPSSRTGTYIRPHSVTAKFRRILIDANIPPIKFNDLRHTFAVLALKQGMDISVVSQMLGYARVETAMRRYGKEITHNQQAVAYAMSNLLRGNDAQHEHVIPFSKAV